MAGFGIPQIEIANLVGISDRTLRDRYRRELDTGATEANLRVAQSLYTLAVKERNVAACIWWTKARMGWREQVDSNTANGANTHFVFEWAASDPPVPAAPKPMPPPTIDVEPSEVSDAADTALTVTWAGE